MSVPASTVSEAVRRLEDQLGTRLMNRTTRSVALTVAGSELMTRILPVLAGLDSAMDTVAGFGKGLHGTLRLNVPGAVTRTILPPIAADFLHSYPEIRLDITVDDGLVDILSMGADAGIRYGEMLAQDAIFVPIGPRHQRMAAAASPGYLAEHGTPHHPRDLLAHACLRTRFPGGALTDWEFEKDGETVTVDPPGPLTISTQAAEFAIDTAISGHGIVATFEDWLRPAMDDGRLTKVLEDWWPSFEGPFLYYSSRRHMPPPLRAFVDFIKARPRKTTVLQPQSDEQQ